MEVKIKKEEAIKRLDSFIEIAKRSSSNYKVFVYGFASALSDFGIIDSRELELLLKERGAW